MPEIKKGKATNIFSNIIGRIVDNDSIICGEKNILLYNEDVELNQSDLNNLSAIITKGNHQFFNIPTISNVNAINDFSTFDIVELRPNGKIIKLFDNSSSHNVLFLTESCNNNCLMCSQPSVKYLEFDNLKKMLEVIPLIPKKTEVIGITGGEPSLLFLDFIGILKLLNEQLPETEINILTNGRLFAYSKFVELLAPFSNRNVVYCIPLYSDYYLLHDYIVQAKNAFEQTILGLHNLARFKNRIEIRIVLQKINLPRLSKLSKFIFKNLPFVEHVAFMGLEHIGNAVSNRELTYYKPSDLIPPLMESINYLSGNGINVSIYNIPLCQLPTDFWQYSRQSISDWKQSYLNKCDKCCERENCSGIFNSSIGVLDDYIRPIQI